jgi:hypothetical protein
MILATDLFGKTEEAQILRSTLSQLVHFVEVALS